MPAWTSTKHMKEGTVPQRSLWRVPTHWLIIAGAVALIVTVILVVSDLWLRNERNERNEELKLAVEKEKTAQAEEIRKQREAEAAIENEKTAQARELSKQKESETVVEKEKTARAQETSKQKKDEIAIEKEKTAQAREATQQSYRWATAITDSLMTLGYAALAWFVLRGIFRLGYMHLENQRLLDDERRRPDALGGGGEPEAITLIYSKQLSEDVGKSKESNAETYSTTDDEDSPTDGDKSDTSMRNRSRFRCVIL